MHLLKTYDEPGQDVAQRSDRHINPAGCGAWRGLDAPGKQPLKYLAAESRLKVSARIGRKIILRWSIDSGCFKQSTIDCGCFKQSTSIYPISPLSGRIGRT